VPIPLHKKRLRQRGFNQSDVVANALCEITGLELRHLLTREKNTVQIAKLPHDNTRAKQIKGAFFYDDTKPVPETVILVDDVVTTGATAQEAAKTLKRAGVERVLVFSIA
jgi:ComF family protein